MNYPEIVAASISAGDSILVLAAALAREIPVNAPESGRRVAAAREESIEAGGYVRSVRTWIEWREIGLYANGEWAAGLGFHEHKRAKRAGISIEDLRQNPRAVEDKRAADEAKRAADTRAAAESLAAELAARAARDELGKIRRTEHEADKPARAAAATEATLAALDRGPSPERAPAEPLGSWAIDERAAASARERLRTSGQVSVATIERESSSTRAGGSAGLVRIVRQYLADFVDLTDDIERKIVRDELASILAELDSE